MFSQTSPTHARCEPQLTKAPTSCQELDPKERPQLSFSRLVRTLCASASLSSEPHNADAIDILFPMSRWRPLGGPRDGMTSKAGPATDSFFEELAGSEDTLIQTCLGDTGVE